MLPDACVPPQLVSTTLPPLLLVIDLIDEETGLAEIEDERGRIYTLPAEWLPEASDGQAYWAALTDQGVRFDLAQGGAALLREKSKQTLLDFSDDFDGER